MGRAKSSERRPGGWLRALGDRRVLVLALAAALFGAVTILRWYVERSGQDAALLYVVPIALVAGLLGHRAGLVAAATGAVLFILFALLHGRGDLDFTGWTAPIVTMGLVGGLVGLASERAAHRHRQAQTESARRLHLEELCRRQQEALEVGDLIVQGALAAKWMMELGMTEKALDSLNTTVHDSTRMTGALSPDQGGVPPELMEPSEDPGDLSPLQMGQGQTPPGPQPAARDPAPEAGVQGSSPHTHRPSVTHSSLRRRVRSAARWLRPVRRSRST